MDKQNLSKYKHIYRVYEDSTGTIHCTKYPIIYINSKVVYFKDVRKQEFLNNVYINNVSDDFTSYAEKMLSKSFNWRVDHYFWSVEDNIEDLFLEFRKQRSLAQMISQEKMITDRYERAKKELEAAEAELAKLVLAKGE